MISSDDKAKIRKLAEQNYKEIKFEHKPIPYKSQLKIEKMKKEAKKKK